MVKLSMERGMVKELCCTIMIGSIKDFGKMITNMGEGFRCSPMGQSIRESILMENLKESENINGLMENFIRDNGLMGSNMVQECGKELKVIVMWVSGEWEKLKVTEFMSGSMAIAMKVILRIVSSMVRVLKNLLMETFTKENT